MNQSNRLYKLRRILRVVSKYYGLKSSVVISKDRHQHVSDARAVYFYIAHELRFLPAEASGPVKKDRTTSINAVYRIKDRIDIKEACYDQVLHQDTEYLFKRCYKFRKIRRRSRFNIINKKI